MGSRHVGSVVVAHGLSCSETHRIFLDLIQASMESRVERIMRKQNMTEEEARKTIERVDKMRENYVKKYTGTSRYDTRNYQLVIAADGKTEEQMADLIMQYIED